MKLREWEQTLQQMIEESNQQPKESGKSKLLTEWRTKLAREPYLLQPYQIDEIVREFRKRLTSVNPQPTSISLAQTTLTASLT